MDDHEREPDTFVLASFCNLLQNEPTLGVLEGRTLRFAYAPLADLPPSTGVTGLTANDRYVFAVVHNTSELRRSALLALERHSFAVAASTELSIPRDAHSIQAVDEVVYVVSTGTDEVVALRLDGPTVAAEEVVWRPPAARERVDTHHLNAISTFGSRLVVSGFGPKEGEAWTSARSGFVWDIEADQAITAPIYHPHSVTEVSESLLGWCASGPRRVELLDGHSSRRLPGYTRGLCISQGRLFAATSRGRSTPRLQRAFSGLGQSGGGSCAIVRVDPAGLKVEASLELSGGVREIYDLLPVELARSEFDDLVAGSAPAPGTAPGRGLSGPRSR
ncbi:MAG: DUF4915 domain-containing protein [Thermoleophilia bacterium]